MVGIVAGRYGVLSRMDWGGEDTARDDRATSFRGRQVQREGRGPIDLEVLDADLDLLVGPVLLKDSGVFSGGVPGHVVDDGLAGGLLTAVPDDLHPDAVVA